MTQRNVIAPTHISERLANDRKMTRTESPPTAMTELRKET